MRIRILVAAALLVLAAAPAQALPVIAAAIAGSSILGALASTLFSVLSSLLLGALTSALKGKPPGAPKPAGNVTTTIRASEEPQRLVYGQRDLAGVAVFVGTARTGQQTEDGVSRTTVKDLHMVLALCRGPVTELGDVYFNDTISTDARWDHQGVDSFTLSKHLGSASQAADAALIAAMPAQWTTAHRLMGIAYLYAKLAWEDSPLIWVTGIPNIRCMVRGLALYDPRNGLTRYSRNPALALRHYLLLAENEGGFGASLEEIDDAYVIAAANACDEVVDISTEGGVVVHGVVPSTDELRLVANTHGYGLGDRLLLVAPGTPPGGLADGAEYWWTPTTGQDPNKLSYGKLSTSYANALAEVYVNITSAGAGTMAVRRTGQVRYTCDAVVILDERPADIIDALLSSMTGRLAYTQGKWRMFAGVARAASFALGPGNLRGAMVVQTRTPRRELFNAVRGTLPDASRYYQETSFPAVKNAAYAAADGGAEIFRDIALPCTTSPLRAQRIAKVQLEQARQGIVVKAPMNWSALPIAVGDVGTVDDAALGWSAKEFEVVDWVLAEGGGVDLVLQEYAAAIFDWDDGEATRLDPAPDTELPNWADVQAPGLSLADDFVVQGGGLVNRLLLTVTLPTDEFVSRTEVEYREEGAADWIPVSGNIAQIVGVEDGVTYEVRVRAINTLGAPSEWTTATHQVVGQSAAPGDIDNYAVNIVGDTAFHSWTLPADLDISHLRLRFSPDPAQTVWSNMIDLVPQIARAATSIQTPAMIGAYAIKAVDFKGNESPNAAISASTIAGITGLNAVESLTAEPLFEGTLDGTLVVEDTLRLQSGGMWDSLDVGETAEVIVVFGGMVVTHLGEPVTA